MTIVANSYVSNILYNIAYLNINLLITNIIIDLILLNSGIHCVCYAQILQ